MTVNTTPTPISGPYAAGAPGPQGLWPEGNWSAGTSIKNTVVSHNNRVWRANKTTTQEPSDSASDWDLWIDAQGAELAGGFAEAADAASALAVAAKNDTIGLKADTQTIHDNTLAIERRIRAQDLGDFASDADALAWAAGQTPPISVVVGSSYWNTTTLIKRVCSDSATTPKTFVNEDADAAVQRTNAQTAAVAATDAATDAAASALSAASFKAFRNLIRNADFRINQRGVSGTVTLAAGAYGHDGVKAGASGATYTFAESGLDVTLTISAGSIVLPIEYILIEGGVYRVSHQGTAQARVWQGSSPSGSYAAAPFSTASLSAVTRTNVEFGVGTVKLPQFELGTSETAFERRPYWMELAFCQRYYYRRTSASAVSDIVCFASAYAGGSVWAKLFDLPVEMRADGGTVGFSAISHLSVCNAAGSTTYAGSSVSGAVANKRSVAIFSGLVVTGTPGFTIGQALMIIFNTTSGWIDVSAEI